MIIQFLIPTAKSSIIPRTAIKCTRGVHSSATCGKWARYYDQSAHPPVTKTPHNLKWLWRTPDPPAYPKTISKTLAEDGSEFHQFIRKKPLYEYVDEMIAANNKISPNVIEKTLPPIVFDRRQGPFEPRQLSQQEQEEIKNKFRDEMARPYVNSQETRGRWAYICILAEQFQCSRSQIDELCRDMPGRQRRRQYDADSTLPESKPKFQWWFKKKLASTQVSAKAQ